MIGLDGFNSIDTSVWLCAVATIGGFNIDHESMREVLQGKHPNSWLMDCTWWIASYLATCDSWDVELQGLDVLSMSLHSDQEVRL